MFSLLESLQENISSLKTLRDKFCSTAADSVTIDEIKLAAACTRPPHVYSTELFFEAVLGLLSWKTDDVSSVYDMLASVGVVPIILLSLTHFPDEIGVLDMASDLLRSFAFNCSAAVKSETRALPGIDALLEAASTNLQAHGLSLNVADIFS